MDERGQVSLPIPGSVVAVALVLSIAQALEVEAVTIPTYVWELGRWLVVVLVGVVAWFLRQTFKEHDERIKTLEKRIWELKREQRRDIRDSQSGDGS